MEHTESATNRLLWWFISVTFNLVLYPFTLCARSSHHLMFVPVFYLIPSYWFYCNEWNSKLRCIVTEFMLYLLYGQTEEKKKHCLKKKKRDKKQKHYRCNKGEVFFFPAVFFYAVAKKKKKKVVFFNVFSSNFNSDAKLGPHLSAPSEHRSKFRLLFLRFYQKVFKDGTTFSFFSVWIVLLFLSKLHFTNKTLILL